MEDDETESRCENCYYYAQHYVKRNLEYIKVAYVSCRQADRRSTKLPKEACKLWVRAKRDEEIEQSIIKVLRKTSKELHDIASILKDINQK